MFGGMTYENPQIQKAIDETFVAQQLKVVSEAKFQAQQKENDRLVLEANGIATVVMGCAKDIVEYVGVPRFLFSDFPLGNGAGRPNDVASQAFTLDLALSVLEAAPAPRTTVQSPLRWSASPDWKLDYCNIERLTPEEIRRRRAEFDEGKAQARHAREEAGTNRFDAHEEIG